MSNMVELMDSYLGISKPKVEEWKLNDLPHLMKECNPVTYPGKRKPKTDNPYKINWAKLRQVRSTINMDYYTAI